MSKKDKGNTFNDYIAAAEKKGVNLKLIVKRQEDYTRLAASGLPTFEYKQFEQGDYEGIKQFKKKYPIVVCILYPKKRGDPQPWDLFSEESELEKFLQENEPLNRFRIRLGQNKKPDYGGTIIIDEYQVKCELGTGNQANLAHGISDEIWWARKDMLEHSFKYSENSTEKEKEMMWKSLNTIREWGEGFPIGYYEFFVCNELIYFIDYKTDPYFWDKMTFKEWKETFNFKDDYYKQKIKKSGNGGI